MSEPKLIANRYTIDDFKTDLIGRGGMGDVYRGRDTLTGEHVAIKALKSEIMDDEPELVQRFVREGEALRQLNHPNIVKMLAADEVNGRHYLVMEYVEGGSLQERIRSELQLSLERVMQIGLELADALTRAHLLKIIHRDLKPANVLLAADGTPRLTDFGIAHMKDSPRLTQSGVLMGTIHYISPEACVGDELDVRADIWAFGVLLYEMLTGDVPFRGEATYQTLVKIMNEPVPDINQYREGIPPSLAKLIYMMLEKDRERRVHSVRLVGLELEAIIHGHANTAISTAVTPPATATAALTRPILTQSINKPNEIRAEHLAQLRQKLELHFSLDEIQTLCFDLNIDFENLTGSNKEAKARELVSFMARNGRIPELVEKCSQLRPNAIWAFQADIFICYKRNNQTDTRLAMFLYKELTEAGHDVFIDQTTKSGTAWLEAIDERIKRSNFLVVLLSQESTTSEMVQAEVRRAHDYHNIQGHPQILPIRMAFSGLLPYSIDAFLNPFQYIEWQNDGDNGRVLNEINQAIESGLPEKTPATPKTPPSIVAYSEDGRRLETNESTPAPLPEFDPRLLDELSAPGGAVQIRDKFYVVREDDGRLQKQIVRPGSITTIRASRQTGKSSLLVRGIHYAKKQGAHIVNIDLQRIGSNNMETADDFLRYMAQTIVRKLRLNPREVETAWESSLGPQDKLTYLMEDYVLPEVAEPIVIAMDEVDRLLNTNYQNDFFALMRSWHNSGAYDDLWELVGIVMVISTEPYLLIADVNQSPFNVGLKLNLKDFNETQVQDLNQRHGNPVHQTQFRDFMNLLGGQPYLTRAALYTLVAEKMSWEEFMRVAPTTQGPFSDHLRRQQWLLRDDDALRLALKQIIRQNRCDDESARFRLQRAGLIKGSGDHFIARCDLYRKFFKDKL